MSEEPFWLAVLLLDAGLALIFVASLLWAATKEPVDTVPFPEVPGFNKWND